jgi:hypothetical protein
MAIDFWVLGQGVQGLNHQDAQGLNHQDAQDAQDAQEKESFIFEHLGFWGEFWVKEEGFVVGEAQVVCFEFGSKNKDFQKDKDFKTCSFGTGRFTEVFRMVHCTARRDWLQL